MYSIRLFTHFFADHPFTWFQNAVQKGLNQLLNSRGFVVRHWEVLNLEDSRLESLILGTPTEEALLMQLQQQQQRGTSAVLTDGRVVHVVCDSFAFCVSLFQYLNRFLGVCCCVI